MQLKEPPEAASGSGKGNRGTKSGLARFELEGIGQV